MGQPEVLNAVGLGAGHRENDRARQVGVFAAIDRYGAVVAKDVEVGRVRGNREWWLGSQLEPAVLRHQALPEGDRADVSFADGPKRHQDPSRILVEAALIGMRYDAGVHQR